MVRSKQVSSKKQKTRGVDFKKIKRKIGRKLPPPKNATDTQIKSKAIILPEQSVASDRTGLAVSKKGLTLKELLHQTSHHNPKFRKDALIGIRDLSLKFPSELTLHKLSIIEKLRERIADDDRVVRETLYQLFKSVIFTCPKEDDNISAPVISLLMAYVLSAMTHLAFDIRFMAFKFLDLVILHYPSSFSLHAERVLQSYVDVLRNNQSYLQDKSKLKVVLVGLARCLSLLPCDKKQIDSSNDQSCNARQTLHAFELDVPEMHTSFSSISKELEFLLPILTNYFQELYMVESKSFDCMLCILQSINRALKFFLHGIKKPRVNFGVSAPSLSEEADIEMWCVNSIHVKLKKLFDTFPLQPLADKEDHRYLSLNIGITEIFLRLNEWIGSPAALLDKFLLFIEDILLAQASGDLLSNKVLLEKHAASLLPFFPGLVSRALGHWQSHLLEAFTRTYVGCKPESSLNLACLSAVKEMLLPTQRQYSLFCDWSCPNMISYQLTWIKQLPELLLRLGDMHPSISKAVLHLQLRLGQCAPMNSPFVKEYDNMQCQLREFYSVRVDERTMLYGPFIKLPKDCQELAVYCLYYFSCFDPWLLESLTCCCLCDALERDLILQMIEILQSAYKAGHIQITDHISFLFTLLARFKVLPEKVYFGLENEERISNRGTFQAITNAVFSCLSQMGDNNLILKILQKNILNEISLRPSLDNMHAIFKMLVILGWRPTTLPRESINILSHSLFDYLIGVAALYVPENDEEVAQSCWKRIFQYYIQPVAFLLNRSEALISLVLSLLGSSIAEIHSQFPVHESKHYAFEPLSRVHAVTSILISMHKDMKIQQSLSSFKEAVNCILQNILRLHISNETNMTLQERYKVQWAFDRLRVETGGSLSWDANDVQRISQET